MKIWSRVVASILLLFAFAGSTAVASARSAADPVTPGGHVDGGLVLTAGPDGPTAAERAVIDLRIKQFEEAHPDAVTTRTPYSFYPHGGNLWQDLFINNYTDQDGNQTNGSWQDFDCTEFAYDGHQGHDSIVRTFVEKRIGVPIFAALPGTVVDRHDGEPDENTTLNNVPANYVIVEHTGGHRTLYWHMRNGSVAVALNQQVVAGQQLGLTASSGYSNWPHLHFESWENGVWFEPNSGACGPGTSNWTTGHQPNIQRGLWVRDFAFSPSAFSNTYPDDTAVRTGNYSLNATQIHFRVELGDGNAVASPTYTVRVRRPDNSIASTFSGTFSGAGRSSIWWFTANVNLNTLGTWHAELDYRGIFIVNAPFDVINGGRVLGPYGINANFDPAAPKNGDVLFCRVQTSLLFEHPDYHVVRYRYRWLANGTPIRDNTFGGLADALPSNEVTTGRNITCEVTPISNSNGIAGPTTTRGPVTVTGPTEATLRALTAKRTPRGTLVRWRTGAESNLLGFNLYRAGVRVNRTLISCVFGGAAHGHAYSWLDRAPPKGRLFRYRLQGITLNGARRWLGSVAVGS